MLIESDADLRHELAGQVEAARGKTRITVKIYHSALLFSFLKKNSCLLRRMT